MKKKARVEVKYPVYYVESVAVSDRAIGDRDNTVLVAIEPLVIEDKHIQHIQWYDTNKLRDFLGTVTADEETNVLSFTDPQKGYRYTMTPLTLEIYEQCVRPNLHNAPAFSSMEDLYEAMLATRQNEW